MRFISFVRLHFRFHVQRRHRRPESTRSFGDNTDKNSKVSQAKAQDRNYVLIAELNNHPRTSFLAKIRNPHPSLAPAEPAGHGHGGKDGHDDGHAGEEHHG